jgi:hypothetical protein
MLRTGALLLLLMFTCGKSLAGIGVELDVVFSDSTVQCRYFYVLIPNAVGANDTLAVFDSLSFNGQNRVSLFYSVRSGGKNMLAMIDSAGVQAESKPFKVSPKRTTFDVVVGQRQIEVTAKDYLYLRKNNNERSYYVFLVIFLSVKFLITAVFVLSSKQRKRIIAISCGAFLLSAFIDWLFPLNYLYRFFIIILVEYLLISLIGHKFISWLRAAMLVLTVNIAGFGMIAILYLLYVFW